MPDFPPMRIVYASMSEVAYAELTPRQRRSLFGLDKRVQAYVKKMEDAAFKRLRSKRSRTRT